jgi:hypothetical protein
MDHSYMCHMKRRTFIQSMAAAVTAPALPTKLLAGGSGVPAAVYAKAVHYAKLWDTSVPEMYTSALGLDHDQAYSLFDRLVADRVIAAPNAAGMGRAVLPYYRDPAMAQKIANILRKPGTPALGSETLQQAKSPVDTLKKRLADLVGPDKSTTEVKKDHPPEDQDPKELSE